MSVTRHKIAEKPTTRPTKKPTEETTGTTETKIVTTEMEEENLETSTATKSPPPTTPAPSKFSLLGWRKNKTPGYQRGLLMYKEGTVCDDNFRDETADALCKEMGYGSMISWHGYLRYEEAEGDGHQFRYSRPIYDLECPSETASYDSCIFTTYHDCSHREDVFLTCATGLVTHVTCVGLLTATTLSS